MRMFGHQFDLSKRVVPAAVGLVALFSLPYSLTFAVMSYAESPEAEILSKAFFVLHFTKPLMLVATAAMAFLVVRSYSRRRVVALLMPPGLWWAAMAIVAVLNTALCPGAAACAGRAGVVLLDVE